jgi:hypothetical protein
MPTLSRIAAKVNTHQIVLNFSRNLEMRTYFAAPQQKRLAIAMVYPKIRSMLHCNIIG